MSSRQDQVSCRFLFHFTHTISYSNTSHHTQDKEGGGTFSFCTPPPQGALPPHTPTTMLSAMSCVAAAVLANTQFSHTELTGAETAPTVDTVQQYYMGEGRYVKINSLTLGTGVSNLVVGYQDTVADQGSLNDTCLLGRCTDQMSFEILNPFMMNATCLIKNFAEPDVNKTCALVLGTGGLNVSDAITSVSSTLPYYFKSPGFNKKHVCTKLFGESGDPICAKQSALYDGVGNRVVVLILKFVFSFFCKESLFVRNHTTKKNIYIYSSSSSTQYSRALPRL